MFAKNLEVLFLTLAEEYDMSGWQPDDMSKRFDALRRYGLLPKGRERRAQLLTPNELSNAILGLVPTNPAWAGHAATVLRRLVPVGGINGSFFGNLTLAQTIERILTDSTARRTIIRLSVSAAAHATNAHGYASLWADGDNVPRHVSFVSYLAHSLTVGGAEKKFEREKLHSPISREIAFNRQFFDSVADAAERAIPSAMPAGDGSEYDAEEVQQERMNRLGVRFNSRFLNIGVDNQVTWPRVETLVKFDRYHFVLMPKTAEHVQSVHVDLTANGVNHREAITVVNRFLSIMTWCDDQFAILQDGWSGNPIPVAVRRRNLAFATTDHWAFYRKIPETDEARRALALFREARNAQQNYLVSYAVLNFYKIVEIRHPGKNGPKVWFRSSFEALKGSPLYSGSFARFLEICGNEKPHEYLYKACRIAVAHAGEKANSDPDDAAELTRLHTAADVLHILARYFISAELGVSHNQYSGD